MSPRDAGRWPRFCDQMHAFAGVLEHLYASPPPDPLTHQTRGYLALARAALRLRKLGRADTTGFMQVLPMSIADLLDNWFESDALKGVLGTLAVRDLAQGPRAGGTAFNFLHHHVGAPRGVFAARRVHDAVVPPNVTRIAANAVRIEATANRVVGVALDNGDTVRCDVIASAVDPKRTLLELCDVAALDPELVRSLRNIRSRGVTAYVTFAVRDAPGFETLVIAPSLTQIERAHDDSKYGRVSREPIIEATYDVAPQSSAAASGTASNAGLHRVTARVQYVPYALREGEWNAARRKELADTVTARIGLASPGFTDRVVDVEVLTPAGLEAQYGWPQGQPHHAEIALDQVLWMRPVPELARYRTPIGGLYLCGPAMHPAIPGVCGAHVAAAMIEDIEHK